MGWEAWVTLVVLVATVAVLIREYVAPSQAVVSAVILLLVVGVISPQQALAGFSNPAPITIAALYVLARGVEKTGALRPLVTHILERGNGRRGSLARLLIPTVAASALLNNTPIVAMLSPEVSDWAERRGRPGSWYLMPISFAALLGGTITLVGTSTNVVISGMLEAEGFAPLGMFELTRIGLPVAIAGLAILLILAPIVLPDRKSTRERLEEGLREFVFPMEVEQGGPLDGRSVRSGGLRNLEGVFLAEIARNGEIIAPATPRTVLKGGDRLMFVGRADLVVDLQTRQGLRSTEHTHLQRTNGGSHMLCEAVVSEASSLAGHTLKESGFRERYQGAVLAIHRAGEPLRQKLGSVQMRAGDTLLVHTDTGFHERWRDRSDFLLVTNLGDGHSTPKPPGSTRRAAISGLILLAVIVAAGTGLVPVLNATLIGALGLVATRTLSPGEAWRAIDFDVVVLIAAAFGLAAAMEASGLAQALSAAIVEPFRVLGPRGILFAVVIATMLFTELITNNAAAVLFFPVAVAAATTAGVDPRPFAIAVAIAASASFLTPIGCQTNMMVYGPGGYRFTDYFRLGAPLNLMVIVLVVLLAPLFWPF